MAEEILWWRLKGSNMWHCLEVCPRINRRGIRNHTPRVRESGVLHPVGEVCYPCLSKRSNEKAILEDKRNV